MTNASPRVGARKDTAADAAGRALRVRVKNGGMACPDRLAAMLARGSGHHQEIRRWRRRVALAKTLRNRPELLASAALTLEDLKLLDEIRSET